MFPIKQYREKIQGVSKVPLQAAQWKYNFLCLIVISVGFLFKTFCSTFFKKGNWETGSRPSRHLLIAVCLCLHLLFACVPHNKWNNIKVYLFDSWSKKTFSEYNANLSDCHEYCIDLQKKSFDVGCRGWKLTLLIECRMWTCGPTSICSSSPYSIYHTAMFLNQWYGYHQWYMKPGLVVLTGMLDTFHPILIPGIWWNKQQ